MESIESIDKEIKTAAPDEKKDIDKLEDIKNGLSTITALVNDLTEKIGALKEAEETEDHTEDETEEKEETEEPEEPEEKEGD